MQDNKKNIIGDLRKIVKDLTGQDLTPNLEHPKDERHGDYSTNIAMAIFSSAKRKTQNAKFRSPMDLAHEIVNKFNVQSFNRLRIDPERSRMGQSLKSKVTDKIEAVEPGFINFWLSKEYLTTLMIRIIRAKDAYGSSNRLANKKIMVEFTDPNPFKEFHIGHLYSNTVGEALSRLFESQGAVVWRVCYQGDVGLHVAKAIWGMKRIMEKYSEDLKAWEVKPLSTRAWKLGSSYALGSKAYEEDQKAKEEIIGLNKMIYDQDQSIEEYYKKGKEWSLDYFDKIYQRLGTEFKRFYFESEAADVGSKIVRENKGRVFEDSDGAVIFPGEKYGLHNRVFLNAQGLPTYEAKELGLAPIKYKDFKYDQSIIITGNEIIEYFKVLLKALEQIYPDLAKKTKHIGHGMVRLPGGKLSSRLGNILLTGEWLVDETKKRIQKSYPDMDKTTEEKVAVGAVKYALLKSSIGKDIEFDFDESISLEGNSGPYLQYTFARTQSVLAKVKSQPFDFAQGEKSKVKFSLVRSHLAKLEVEEESILRAIYRFPEVVEEAAEKFAPNIICNYLFDLTQKFNLFYQRVPIIKEATKSAGVASDATTTFDGGVNVRHPRRQHSLWRRTAEGVIGTQGWFRLALTAAVGQVIKNGLHLLGIESPERM